MAEISKFNGYDLKDKQSRADIETLKTTVEGKLDKQAPIINGEFAYTFSNSDQFGLVNGYTEMSTTDKIATIARRKTNGCIETRTPGAANEAANKGYVDGLVDDIKDGTIKVSKAALADRAINSDFARNANLAEYYESSTGNPADPVIEEKRISDKFNEVDQTIQDVANGVCKGYSFDSMDRLIGDLEGQKDNTKYKIGDELYIKAADKPDYWVAEVNGTKGPAVGSTFEDGDTVGYWVLYKLGEKTDLTEYQKKADTTLKTTSKTVAGAINEVKSTADGADLISKKATASLNMLGFVEVADVNGLYALSNAFAGAAIKDDRNQNIAGTYIKELTNSRSTISYVKGNGTIGSITLPDTTYAQATSTVLGLVKIGYASSGRNYAVALDASGKMYVNVPWENSVYTLPVATTTVRGGVKVGAVRSTAVTANAASSTDGRYYMVERDSAEKLFVNIPWQNTTYGLATQSANGLMSAADKTKLDHIGISVTGEEMTITLS